MGNYGQPQGNKWLGYPRPGYGPPPSQKRGMGPWRIALNIVGATFILFFGSIVLCVALGRASRTSESSANGGSALMTPAASVAAVPMPDDERAFCSTVATYEQQYAQAKGAGANELKLSKIRTERREALLQTANINVTGWVGTIDKLATNSDGRAYVSVTLPCNATVKTWNNGLSDVSDNTLIAQSSTVYDAFDEAGEGKRVSFNGSFFPSAQDGFKEASMSEEGSLSDPEFIFRFSRVGR